MTDGGHGRPPFDDSEAPPSTSDETFSHEESVEGFKRRLEAATTDGERAEALRKMVLELLERVSKESPAPPGG